MPQTWTLALPCDPLRTASLISVIGLFLKFSHNDFRSKAPVPCAFKQWSRFINKALIPNRVFALSDQPGIPLPNKPKIIIGVVRFCGSIDRCFGCKERPCIPEQQRLSVVKFGNNVRPEYGLLRSIRACFPIFNPLGRRKQDVGTPQKKLDMKTAATIPTAKYDRYLSIGAPRSVQINLPAQRS